MKIDRTLQLPSAVPTQDKRLAQEEQLKQAAEMYEQVFMQEMVKAMRQTVPEGGLVPTSMGEKIFREQLDQQYIQNWSDRGGTGLADMIYKHVKERYLGGGSSDNEK